MIHITDGQSDNLLDFITKKNIFTDTHRESLQDNLETFEFETFADKSFSEHITKRNRLVIPAEDEGYKELIIHEAIKYHDGDGLRLEVYSTASYLELKKAKIIEPQSFKEETPVTAVSRATNGTEWRPGIIEGAGFRTFVFEEYTNPFAFLKTIANEFELELRFRVEISGNRITGRFVDLLNRVGNWKGREVSFDKDLIGIKRTEKTDNVFTALLGLGVEREDETQLKVLVEDKDALQRWGRKDPVTGELKHLIETYQPESTRTEMAESELRQYTRTELNKRINAVVEYEADIADLENVPGMENKKIRFGDTIKIRDTKFEPPLYLEARVHTQERSITDPSKKTVTLGDYIEYTEEQVMSAFKEMREEINRRFARLLVTNVLTSAGNTFKNGEGETELTAKVFLSGAETDAEGDFYTYAWKKFDKRGIPVSGWSTTGKTIRITANEIDEKATYQVEIIADSLLSIGQVTLSNIYDGQDGEQGPQGIQGPKGEDGKSLYTWVKYADSPTSGMSDTPDGKKYIGLAYNKETPTESNSYSDYEWAKIEGNQGVPGEPGKDGTPRYTWVKYADDENGSGMSDSAEGKRYLGLAHNKTTASESSNPSDYSWSPLYDNVKVGGRNFILGSSRLYRSVNIGAWTGTLQGNRPISELSIQPGDDITMSFYAKLPDGAPDAIYPRFSFFREDGTYSSDPGGERINPGDEKFTTYTTKVPSDCTGIAFAIQRTGASSTAPSFTIEVKGDIAEKGNIPSDYDRAPENVDKDIKDAEDNAKGHADAVSEAAYLDAIRDAEEYMGANGVMQGRNYNGVSITNQDGFVTARGDGLVRTVMNSTLGYVVQRRASTSSSWQDVIYFDTNGNAKYAGDLVGATGTFGEVTVQNGDFNLEDDVSNVKYSVTPKRNMIKDHSFELLKAGEMGPDSVTHNWVDVVPSNVTNEDHWKTSGSPKLAVQFAPEDAKALAIYGNQAIVVRDANFVRQHVYDGIGGGAELTISAFFKRQWNATAGGTPRFEVDRIDSNGNRQERLINQIFDPVPNDYSVVRRAATFTVPSTFTTGDTLDIKISGGNNRWIQCDGVQLVEESKPSVYQPEDSIWEIADGSYPAVNQQNLLWAGAVYLLDSHTIVPDKVIDECKNGWILGWSAYSIGNGALESDWKYTIVPKRGEMSRSYRELFFKGGTNVFVHKFFYVHRNYLTGHSSNGSGDNRNVVLRTIHEF